MAPNDVGTFGSTAGAETGGVPPSAPIGIPPSGEVEPPASPASVPFKLDFACGGPQAAVSRPAATIATATNDSCCGIARPPELLNSLPSDCRVDFPEKRRASGSAKIRQEWSQLWRNALQSPNGEHRVAGFLLTSVASARHGASAAWIVVSTRMTTPTVTGSSPVSLAGSSARSPPIVRRLQASRSQCKQENCSTCPHCPVQPPPVGQLPVVSPL
jgi:hypothetical protein